MDVDTVLSWPLSKIYRYMAFYRSETQDFKERYEEEMKTPDDKAYELLRFLGG